MIIYCVNVAIFINIWYFLLTVDNVEIQNLTILDFNVILINAPEQDDVASTNETVVEKQTIESNRDEEFTWTSLRHNHTKLYFGLSKWKELYFYIVRPLSCARQTYSYDKIMIKAAYNKFTLVECNLIQSFMTYDHFSNQYDCCIDK